MNIQDTIHASFEAQVEQTPDNIAVIFAGQSFTYFELNERANQFAHYLREMGVKPDTHVALCMKRSVDLLIVILGILKAGGAYVPLDSSHPEERLLYILNDNNTPILIIKSDIKEKFIHYQGKLIVFDHDEKKISEQATPNPNSAVTSQHLAYVIYTSGTTGKPKGVLIEHKSVINYSLWFAAYSRCYPEQRVDFSFNYIFDTAVSTSIVPLMLGLTIVICNDEVKKSARHYLNYLESNNVAIIKITPSYFKVLVHEVKHSFIALSALQNVILGGENLSTLDCSSWLTIYPKHILFNEYGPTEATVAVSQYKICQASLSSLGVNVPIGQCGPNMDYHLLTPDNTPVSEGEIGELYIGGVCLARGYLNQPELTQKQFSKIGNTRLYKTGDLCRQLADGTLECIGRIDHQIKIRGFRIEPGEIEKYLAAHPAIDNVVVLARDVQFYEKRLIAYFIPKNVNTAPSTKQLRQYLQIHLPDYMIPTAFVKIAAFPLTANGKLDRSSLPIPQFTTSHHYLEPSTVLEKTLAAIWSEELGIKTIGSKDDFFELGGDSLSAARIISNINNKLRKEVNLNDFYQALTIEKLIPILNNAKKIDEPSLSSNQRFYDDSALLPLSDFQFMLWIANTFEPKAKKLNITLRKQLQGQLDIAALRFAFIAILKKHEVLLYRVFKFRPTQNLQKNLPFKLIAKNLESLSEQESEVVLETSINELIHYYPWPKGKPLLIARLFHLKNEITELQICMPHIVADGVSFDLLLSDLSKLYLLYKNHADIAKVKTDKQYRAYLFNEYYYSQAYLERDLMFWEEYLKDAYLFRFSAEKVVKKMEAQGINYSTYLEIPEQGLNHLHQFCSQNHININDGLCAALALALCNCCDNYSSKGQNIFMNIVKSVRDKQSYDNTIGCFLRLEPIKIALSKKSTLAALCKQIHQAVIDTNPYQRCSSLVKIARIGTLRQEKKIIRSYFTKVFMYIYAAIFRMPRLNRRIFRLCDGLTSFVRNNKFLININVHSNFIASKGSKTSNEPTLFGLKSKSINLRQYDLLKIENCLEICFLRSDDEQNTPYLVISANLKPNFRELIAKEVIRIITSETLVKQV